MQKAKVTLVRFWLKKAQHDLAAARKLAQDLPDIAIYHCQQGAEKALKGFLVLHDLDPGSTHNINTLVTEAAKIAPEFKVGLSAAGLLSQYNQAYRYPGDPTEDFNPSPGERVQGFFSCSPGVPERIASDASRNSWTAAKPRIAAGAKFLREFRALDKNSLAP